MSQTSYNNKSGPVSGRSVHVGLVAGRETLRNLGPVVRHMIVGLLDEPLPVTLFCPAKTDVANIPAPPVQIIEYDTTRIPFLRRRAFDLIAQQVVQSGTSLLHALDIDAASLTSRLAAEAGMDYVIGIYSLGRDVRSLDMHCRAVLAAGEPIRRRLLNSHIGPEGMVHLLRPGVHQAGEATCFVDPAHSTAIVAGGELRDHKYFDSVLEVFARLQKSRQDCVFFIVGNGPDEARLRRMAEKLGLTPNLTFVDRQSPDELKGILRAADIFISPVPSNRLDIELLSAMAAGVPVIAAGAKVCDFVIPDETALTYRPGSASELADKLAFLMNDHYAAERLAEKALEYLRANHSPAKMAGQLIDLYYAVTKKKRPVG
ncbi:MAG: glycosyltransferase family 4 protein [Planctomycetota bacterium]|nr:glycosyltransferase family 4 protein [Planctomycetota bacterium]